MQQPTRYTWLAKTIAALRSHRPRSSPPLLAALLLLTVLAAPVSAKVSATPVPPAPISPLPVEPPILPDPHGPPTVWHPPQPPHPIPPRPVPPPINQVTVDENRVEAVVEGPVAKVTVTQVFRNEGSRPAEGEYVFPLPKDAAVSDFQMKINGETVEGKLLSADEARRIYEEIVRRQRDPALLQYVDRGLFQANVFPIPPGETRELSFTYTQVLEPRDGLYRFNFPLPTRQYSQQPPKHVAVSVELRNQPGLRTIYSPHYPIRIDRPGDDGATISYESKDEQPPADFDLYFGNDKATVGLNVLSYKPTGEDGYFALLAAPSVNVDENAVVARDLVLVVDVSGSMRGDKLEQAKAAARYVVEQLNPEDRFNLIAFSSGTQAWKPELQPVNETTRKDAERWIDRLRATGSTDINRALLEALGQLEPGSGGATASAQHPGYVLFLTDGQPTMGETEPGRIVDNALNNEPAKNTVRLFTFGIGYDVNTDLLDTVSKELGGRSSYVQPDERIDEAVGSFYSQISTPVLANVAVKIKPAGEKTSGDVAVSDVAISDVFPYPLPDLFAGEQLVIVGRYQAGGPVSVELSGTVNGEDKLYVYPEQELVNKGGEPFVAKLWATRRIGALLEQVRKQGAAQELVDEITDLSLRYGIVTPYTSYLVQEPGLQPATGAQNGAPHDGGGAPPVPMAPAADAAKSVAAAAAGAAAAAPAGAEAVQASIERGALQAATTVAEDQAVRYAGGRTFQRQVQRVGADHQPVELWVDTQYKDAMKVEDVEFGSDAYFALLQQPGMAEWLAVAPQVVIVTGADSAVRVTLPADQAAQP